MESETIVLYTSPGIGHLVAMVELGKLIVTHHPSLCVTVLITPAPYETYESTDKYIYRVSSTCPSITFHHLPTITLPPDFPSDYTDAAFANQELYNPLLHKALVTILDKSNIKAVILDLFSNAALQVVKSLNLPTYYFYTSPASALCVFLHLPVIDQTTPKSIKDLNFNLEIPGVPPIHVSDLPFLLFDKETNSYKKKFNPYFTKASICMAESSGIILNTFEDLEQRAVDTLWDGKCILNGPTPPIYLIGPLIDGGNEADASENECLKWLNSQPSNSVVFLCFGSMGVFKKEQLKEIAIGLERSGQNFLWVVRDPPTGDESKLNSGGEELGVDDILPEGFLARTSDKGLVVKNWAPQSPILRHDSVGGFVSHCGWNSTLEAVVSGVPMVAWPLYAEQKMNKAFLVQEMKVALALNMSCDGFVAANVVEETVRELMEGEEGKMVRERVLRMSESAKVAVNNNGSSRVDFSKLIHAWKGDI